MRAMLFGLWTLHCSGLPIRDGSDARRRSRRLSRAKEELQARLKILENKSQAVNYNLTKNQLFNQIYAIVDSRTVSGLVSSWISKFERPA